jgi:hypothetical protein
VTNRGALAGDGFGIELMSRSDVVNSGTSVSTGSGVGIFLGAGGGVQNKSSGDIAGYAVGLRIEGGVGQVTNAGTVTAVKLGVSLGAGGGVDNRASGYIYGNYGGVAIEGPGVAWDHRQHRRKFCISRVEPSRKPQLSHAGPALLQMLSAQRALFHIPAQMAPDLPPTSL